MTTPSSPHNYPCSWLADFFVILVRSSETLLFCCLASRLEVSTHLGCPLSGGSITKHIMCNVSSRIILLFSGYRSLKSVISTNQIEKTSYHSAHLERKSSKVMVNLINTDQIFSQIENNCD